MADTVDLNEITEYFDTTEELRAKVETVADLVRNSQHLVFFTGAGISTSADIPDFRGPTGVWTSKAKGVEAPQGVELGQAIPTFTHMLISTLIAQGKCKYVVSQNIDGLHRRSGVPRANLSELHGNCFLQVCWGCGRDYESPVEVHGHSHRDGECAQCVGSGRVPYFCHCTGQRCACGAELKDSIIHFKENLPREALKRGRENSKLADVCIVLGSSLRVSPANSLPPLAKRLVIVNLQNTPLDDSAAVRVYAKTDDFCRALADRLGMRVAPGPRPGEQPVLHSTSPTRGATQTRSRSRSNSRRRSSTTAPPSAPSVNVPTRAQAPLAPSPVTLCIGNRHEMVRSADGNDHHWTAFVQANREDVIEQVTFSLHPTFQDPVRVVKEAPFELPMRGWGTFTLGVQVAFRPALRIPEFHFDHPLVFQNGGACSTHICSD